MCYENLSPEFGIKSVTLPQVSPVLDKCTLQQNAISKISLEVNTHAEDSNHFQTVLCSFCHLQILPAISVRK